MKKIALFIVLGLITTLAFAQSAQNTMIEFNKTKVPGIVVSLIDYDVATVQAALSARMERIGGLKGSNSKGFRMYAGQIFTDFGNTKFDIYTRVCPGSKKDRDIIINLMVSSGFENFVSQSSDPELNQKMLDFLTYFANIFLKEFDIKQKIDAQTSALEKMEKEYKSLVSDREKLKKDLENKEKAIENKAAEIAKTKETLGTLKNSN